MFPYRDENPTNLTPYITIGIIVLTSIIWLVFQGAGRQPALARSICLYGAVPAELLGSVSKEMTIPLGRGLACVLDGNPSWHTVLTSVFLHGGWFHLIGNMWFLWVFGNNIEDSMGHARFVVFYLLCGMLAAMIQIAVQPGSAVPMVGASGAISGIMGAYLLLYPKVRVHTLVFLGFFVTTWALPAYVILVYWALLQLLGGLPMLGGAGQSGGVAFFAHIGGFIVGLAAIKLFTKRELLQAHTKPAVTVGTFDRGW